MKTVNEKIEDALSDLVDNNIWPLVCPLETPPDKWITYVPEFEAPEEFGDDKDLFWVHHMQIHFFQKGLVDYYEVRSEMRKRLKKAGFTLEQIVPLFEDDTKTTHLVFYTTIIEDRGGRHEDKS